MKDEAPLTHLTALESQLARALETTPTLWSLLSSNLASALRSPANSTAPDALYLAEQPLTHWLAAAIAAGGGEPPTPVEHLTAEGQAPLPPAETQSLLHLARQFSRDARTRWLDSLYAFWNVHDYLGQTRSRWLAGWLREQWQAQLTLREQGRTLAEPARALCHAPLGSEPCWQGMPRLWAGNRFWWLSGAFVLAATNPLNSPLQPVVLSTLAWGIEPFDNWPLLYAELVARLEDDVQGPALLSAMAPSDARNCSGCDRLEWVPIRGLIFEALANSLILRQRHAAQDGWAQALAELRSKDMLAADETLRAACDLKPLLTSTGLRETHVTAQLVAAMPTWLKTLGNERMLRLNRAMSDLRVATAAAMAPELIPLQRFASRVGLEAFARDRLASGLRALGIVLPPERILVSVTRTRATGPLLSPANPAETGSSAGRVLDRTGPPLEHLTHTRNLLQLALDNLSPLDLDYLLTARIRDEHGNAIPGLGAGAVRKLVRQANVGGTYGQYLTAQLRTGHEAQWRRETYRQLLSAKMRYEGLKDGYRGHLGGGDRLHPWIAALLAHPESSELRVVDGQRIEAWQLMIRQAPVHGVYLIGPAPDGQATPVLVYAPDSPDRQYWARFDNRAALAQQWLSRDDVRQYLCARVALPEQPAVRALLSSPKLYRHIDAQRITADVLSNGYLSETRMIIANADALTTSNREVNLDTAQRLALTLIELISCVLPAKVVGSLSVARAAWSAVTFTQSLETSSTEAQLLGAVEMYSHLLEAAVALSSNPLTSKLVRSFPFNTVRPLHPQYAANPASTHLRYELSNADQVIEARVLTDGYSDYFVQDRQGNRYQVMFDGEHWRVIDARKPDALYKPTIQRNARGEWEMLGLPLWKGIVPDIRALLQRLSVAGPENATEGEVFEDEGRQLLKLGGTLLQVRRSLAAGRYTVVHPTPQRGGDTLTLKLRRAPHGSGWQAKLKQLAMASAWLDID
ncbi:dermonecrotic toxin domain-containing protein [Pseudomonas sp. KNUC1026]|uniref:dermonecrotic toxin domain-containing protein n=1 Tax=Pseudomonas sp. KNUC1026 TaxID=2893890 RepID=UPI001F4866ED|nr:DUF6543 domain-containing protein [Pseudomonas sp. KNUC1026]UFH49727.1 hypothetical protein LN139_23715 [Pseudomonas sp. KNUC1026]